jgi:hypothetical protein
MDMGLHHLLEAAGSLTLDVVSADVVVLSFCLFGTGVFAELFLFDA